MTSHPLLASLLYHRIGYWVHWTPNAKTVCEKYELEIGG